MPNAFTVCLLSTLGVLFISQIFLEYFVNILDMSSNPLDSDSSASLWRKAHPQFINTNKIYEDQINAYILH